MSLTASQRTVELLKCCLAIVTTALVGVSAFAFIQSNEHEIERTIHESFKQNALAIPVEYERLIAAKDKNIAPQIMNKEITQRLAVIQKATNQPFLVSAYLKPLCQSIVCCKHFYSHFSLTPCNKTLPQYCGLKNKAQVVE